MLTYSVSSRQCSSEVILCRRSVVMRVSARKEYHWICNIVLQLHEETRHSHRTIQNYLHFILLVIKFSLESVYELQIPTQLLCMYYEYSIMKGRPLTKEDHRKAEVREDQGCHYVQTILEDFNSIITAHQRREDIQRWGPPLLFWKNVPPYDNFKWF